MYDGYMFKNKNGGFTLIELLVVISIIGILSYLLLANFVGVRQRGRDAERKSDLRQIQAAFELYRADNGNYPTSLATCGSAFTANSVTYMQKIPCDPLDKSNYHYSTADSGVTYSIYACLENANDIDGTVNQSCTSGKSYSLTNP